MTISLAPNSTCLRVLFIALFLFASLFSPAVSLFLGIIFSLVLGNPLASLSKRASRHLLQWCVVGLGFGMNLHESLATGRQGMMLTVVSVITVMALGIIVGRWLAVGRKSAYLIGAGTAICGGSAIAAVAPVIDADENETSLSLVTIFVLNAVALLLFPTIGRWIGLSQVQFGTWAAIAIHDTSSVVGAGVAYGEEALKVATTVKLTRALWIIPLSILSAVVFRAKGTKIQIPWFIFWFVVAMVINTYVALPSMFLRGVTTLSHAALSATLFLIGSSLSLGVVRKVGFRPMGLGLVLWVTISVVSLAAIMLL